MNKLLKMNWNEVTDSELQSMDLLSFNGGINPYGHGDNSIFNAFKKGKKSLDKTVTIRTGFTNGRVLDLLSGFGRWLPSLSTNNQEVVAVERLEGCTNIARGICNTFGLDNVTLITADIRYLEKLQPESFDYIWMWSALQYVHRGYAFSQVNRLLKKNGRLFVGAYNSTGIMLEHVMNGVNDAKVHEGASIWALGALAKGPRTDDCPNYCELESIGDVCERYGLTLIASAPEPGLNLSLPGAIDQEAKIDKPFKHYYRTIEFIVEKQGNINKEVLASLELPGQKLNRFKIFIFKFISRIKKIFGR